MPNGPDEDGAAVFVPPKGLAILTTSKGLFLTGAAAAVNGDDDCSSNLPFRPLVIWNIPARGASLTGGVQPDKLLLVPILDGKVNFVVALVDGVVLVSLVVVV